MHAYITEIEIVEDDSLIAKLSANDGGCWILKVDEKILSSENVYSIARVIEQLEKNDGALKLGE